MRTFKLVKSKTYADCLKTTQSTNVSEEYITQLLQKYIDNFRRVKLEKHIQNLKCLQKSKSKHHIYSDTNTNTTKNELVLTNDVGLQTPNNWMKPKRTFNKDNVIHHSQTIPTKTTNSYSILDQDIDMSIVVDTQSTIDYCAAWIGWTCSGTAALLA